MVGAADTALAAAAILLRPFGRRAPAASAPRRILLLRLERIGDLLMSWPAIAEVGRLAPGWQADLQLIDTRFPTPTEAHNLYDQLVLWRNHTHVRLVMVAGQVRVREGVVLGADEDAIRARTHAAARQLWAFAASKH